MRNQVFTDSEFRAYMQLTYVAKYRLECKNDAEPIEFGLFQTLLHQNNPVSLAHIRPISLFYKEHHCTEMKYGNHPLLEQASFKIVQHAFSLGLVNENNLLISKQEYSAVSTPAS